MKLYALLTTILITFSITGCSFSIEDAPPLKISDLSADCQRDDGPVYGATIINLGYGSTNDKVTIPYCGAVTLRNVTDEPTTIHFDPKLFDTNNNTIVIEPKKEYTIRISRTGELKYYVNKDTALPNVIIVEKYKSTVSSL